MKTKIVLASDNLGKIDEFIHYFSNTNIEIIPQNQLNTPEALEPFSTFVENALAKARNVFIHTKNSNLVLADDSGICVPALNLRPGVMSARFAGDNKDTIANNNKLNEQLKNHAQKEVYYICVLVVLRSLNDPDPIIATGRLHGLWVDKPQGTNGFGYDPHFLVPQYCQTLGQLDIAIKNQISHRAQALNKMITILNNMTKDNVLV